MIIHMVFQPPGSTCCAQSCCAMLAQTSLEKACDEFGHRHSSETRETVRFLRSHGYQCPDRLKRLKKGECPSDLCIIKILFGNKKMGHFAVYQDGIVYDPTFGRGTMADLYTCCSNGRARVTSFLPLGAE